jgi:hypothetical protein
MESGCIDPRFLDLFGGERSASRPGRIIPGERAPRYALDRRLGGPKSRCGQHGEMKILAPPGLELRTLGHPARSDYISLLFFSQIYYT